MATWIVLYLPVALSGGGGGGMGGFAFMAVILCPVLILVDAVIFCIAVAWLFCDRSWSGKAGAAVAALVSALFVCIMFRAYFPHH